MIRVVVVLILFLISLYIYPKWTVVIASASLAFGLLSPVVYARRLYFLSVASSHIALLAVVLSIPLSRFILNEYAWSILIGLILMYSAGYAIYRGVNPDVATAIFVSLTASLSVIVMYFVLISFPIETNLWSIILGDPLLVSIMDVFYSVIVSIFILISVILTYREQVYIGIERDQALISGINIKLYEFLFYTMLAVTTIAMLRIVGFVLQHVLILLPSAISVLASKNSRDFLITSAFVSVLSGLVGLNLSVFLNLAPSGVIGLLMFAIYLSIKVKKSLG